MAQTPEGLVKAKVRAILKAAGIWHFTTSTFGMGRSGVPDIIACVNGCFLAIECKAGKGKTTALQDAEIANIEASGGVALVIYEDNMALLRMAILVLRQRPVIVPTPTQENTHEVDQAGGPSPRIKRA